AGLQAGDRIVAVNNDPVVDWYDWVERIRPPAGEALAVELERAGKTVTLVPTPGRRADEQGHHSRVIGAQVAVPEYQAGWRRTSHSGVVEGLQRGWQKWVDLPVFAPDSLWKMLLGDVSVKSLGGPITIAKVAGASAAGGL